MRSITCISLMLAGLPAVAAPLFEPACYARDYGPDHLAAQSAQVVDEIYLRFSHDPKYDETRAALSVLLADQGHVAGGVHAGQVLAQGLTCWADDRAAGCSVECDGGWFEVTRNDGQVLEFVTDYLLVGDTEGCGGAVDLAEVPGQAVTYRLMRVANAVCDERMPR